ncbi:related to acetylcholinesterase precursor [Phialocephala subalpina]|uniref:Carboxylic ester hydrolase n=1 Tax=Phialocephala subalpina TaxID=576137 RepID=A0A1L7WYS2_9HELO|nr:related to acetylcholinesterase precursor [Phialocephala subalpina]
MRVSDVLFFCLAATFTYALKERQLSWTVGQTVQTSSGPVNGHPAGTAKQVSEYLGIPYALPPVGNLRWEPPQKYNGSSTINGTNFGYSCPAVVSPPPNATAVAKANVTAAGLEILDLVDEVGTTFGEDCLTLNVWTKPQTGDAKKAVLVWIYGGGFVYGNTDNPGYNGQYIADQEDVVLVSMNYRLNIFGFPGNPAGTNNLGLLDQRLAIEWVRDNIENFGGDTSRITIFGQSAGGASVDYFTFAWTSDPIVSGLISESGTVFGIKPNSNATNTASWFNVSSTLGCGDATSDSTSVLECMRTKPYTSIISAIPSSNSVTGLGGFGPAVDGVVVFDDYLSRAESGNFIKAPLLVGNADYEAGLFQTIAALKGVVYSGDYWAAFDLIGFTCPAGIRANLSLANNIPTWRYRWFGAFPNTELTTVPSSGAWHASELALLFGNFPFGPGVPDSTTAEVAIGNYTRGAWAAFAKDPVNGLNTYGGGWPLNNDWEFDGKWDWHCDVKWKSGWKPDIASYGTSVEGKCG